MKRRSSLICWLALFAVAAVGAPAGIAQTPSTGAAAKPKPIIFAVLNDGRMIEPIAYVEARKLSEPVSGSDESSLVEAFNKTYYGPGANYRLIFGGANAGTVKVNSSDASMECAPNMAQVEVTSKRATLKGMVMGLATNAPAGKVASGVRRLPTWPERNEIDALIRAEYVKNHVEVTKLDYHNLTALDVDGDKKAELAGSFWVENDPKTRTLMFFIAQKGKDGKYAFGFTEFRTIKETEVMSGEISSLDEGVYHELLLDVFDYNNDGVSEIFTYVRSFEGAGFYVYERSGAEWKRVFEGSNYHCGY
jgi:hypothetical protein